jgi:hypothetical protein
MKAQEQCCSHDCAQGRKCPRRGERRIAPTTFWRRFWQLVREQRGGFDRRARVDMGELPAVNSASSKKETQSIGSPEFHGLLQQVCEVETVLAAAGTTPAVYDAFERASNARKALIAHIDERLARQAQGTTTVFDPRFITLAEKHFGKGAHLAENIFDAMDNVMTVAANRAEGKSVIFHENSLSKE